MWQKFLAWSDNFGKKANPMLKAFLIWFIFFGISFLISSLKWAEQGKAFMFIYVAWPVLLFIVSLFRFLFYCRKNGAEEIEIKTTIDILSLVILLLATWVATQLLNVDYYITFQMVTFGACLGRYSGKKD